ncbi:signal transduction histidine kinase [Salinibacter ruber]|jgi:two-component system OmpR family sensor kinase|uniref:ATP-binding protein n=1 Tax=Salinibacter ruber TaxID=146919 RepID=UPI001F07BBC3|nr:ATP-binding protein [Salinibacter ruber]MCS3628857.1 signal transduction histidine kinase [Salinibacter ruber]MCS3667902.1 signal transduction histidine kinase [Salinibacter ruber]MCS3827185.1 signal transduction histidine kinase [Salinibacter ruber]MCS4145766.1 signal transduction histidine kinase [Salinibacter ruber]
MRRTFTPSGLVIALLGFVLTRYTITFAHAEASTAFVVGGIVPLVLGLSLSVCGVALAIGSFETWYVRTIAQWTVLGAGVIGLLIVATVYGGPSSFAEDVRTIGLFSNVLIGGSVGGALTGVYAAQNKAAQRKLLNRQNRLVILNRLLHDRVMNAVTVIKGSAPLLRDGADTGLESVDAILEKAESIEAVMGSVHDLTEPGAGAERQPVDVPEAVETALQQARERHPDATFVAQSLPSDLSAYANHRLADVVGQLLKNGAEHAGVEAPRVAVALDTTPDTATISVSDEGPGLPDKNREALENGTTISERGDPTAGLGLYLVRLFVHTFRGSVHTEVTDAGTTVSIALERVSESAEGESAAPADSSLVGVAPARLGATALSGLIAGVVMGAYMHVTTGVVPVIGALYGTKSLLVGVLTHEFHSLVFALIYAGLLTLLPRWWRTTWIGTAGVGAAWGAVLWLVAGGLVMPIWLNLVGIATPVPNLNPNSLLAHLLWGTVLAVGVQVSRRWFVS